MLNCLNFKNPKGIEIEVNVASHTGHICALKCTEPLLLADFRSECVWLCGSTGMEVMCFDGEGWLSPAGEQGGVGSEKMPKNRLRQDINQIPREIQRHAACPEACRRFRASATRTVTSKSNGSKRVEMRL